MQYTIPDYYKEFHCIADKCPDTCCAGWQIIIDKKSLANYKKFRGPFRRHLHQGIDFKNSSFRQHGTRCAFLNEKNFCDIYSAAGPHMLCGTCRRYPRHIEEFENLREISLSLSCPEAARIILNQTAPVTYRTVTRDTSTEEYETFDFFLFNVLMDSREYLLSLLQDRTVPIASRMQKALAFAHDLQLCMNRNELFLIEEIRERHESSACGEHFHLKLHNRSKHLSGSYRIMQDMWLTFLPHMEVLRPDWIDFVKGCITFLYGRPEHEYLEAHEAFRASCPDWEVETEQIMVYWVFTYFCSAVYDGNAFSKLKLAVVSTLFIRELDVSCFLKNDQQFTKDKQIDICYRFSRELEHSDENLNTLDKLLTKDEVFSFDKLLKAVSA